MVFETDGNIFGTVVWFGMFFVFMFFYPRIMVAQVLWSLERSASLLEKLTVSGKGIVLKKISTKPGREIREAVSNFLDFFAIEPVGIDPFGIVKKVEHIMELHEKRVKYFVKNVAPKLDSESSANLQMGLLGAMSLHQISKIVRHFIETVKKTKNLQIAMLLQMQLPMIERISKALLKGTEAMANGWPVGDSFGPLVIAHLIGENRVKEVEDTVIANKQIKGRSVIFVKAKGPGGRLGKLGKVVERLIRKNKTAKIITIDAAAKLEGEKTGSVAEGVGVAIGGIGVDRSYIENIATERELPLDSIVVKMSQEEAIMPMRNEVLNATPRVIKVLEDNIARTRESGKIIVVGVGNCSGVGNNRKAAKQSEEQIKKIAKIMKVREEQEAKEEKKWKFLGF